MAFIFSLIAFGLLPVRAGRRGKLAYCHVTSSHTCLSAGGGTLFPRLTTITKIH